MVSWDDVLAQTNQHLAIVLEELKCERKEKREDRKIIAELRSANESLQKQLIEERNRLIEERMRGNNLQTQVNGFHDYFEKVLGYQQEGQNDHNEGHNAKDKVAK